MRREIKLDEPHALVRLCRRRGNDASDLRDAAHEIFHARTVVGKDWDREVVHAKLVRAFKVGADLWVHEMQARAVEQLVCRHYGHGCRELEHWVNMSIMEAIKFRLPYGEYDASLACARIAMTSSRVLSEVAAIIRLADREART